MKEQQIQFNLTARYYTLGTLSPQTKQVWFVIHGYGQLAQYFIKKFKILEAHNIYVIAPEGLSRFYLEDIPTRVAGGSNRVGATWMTRENREMDIKNYISYLQTIYDHELAERNIPITVLGFSQGAATATRWVLHGKVPFDRFVLWAGIFPPDMNFDAGKEIFKKKKIITVFGDEDPFITPERVAELELLSTKLGLAPEKITFVGKHEMNDDVLLRVAQL
ncbi:MAG TPA: alpha/beta hydrolase [Cytophagales bacterium]|nr:alpha/beta hydrolase [Cytophagales bacterium]HCR54817.1 alpha/beta hydrolase [Cytophagales bacterium]